MASTIANRSGSAAASDKISLAHAPVKAQILRSKRPSSTAMSALRACARVRPVSSSQVEEQREVGLQRRRWPMVERLQAIEVEQASVALVGERGVGVAVAEDEHAALQAPAGSLRRRAAAARPHRAAARSWRPCRRPRSRAGSRGCGRRSACRPAPSWSTHSRLASRSHAPSRWICVDLPEPSGPSNVMNISGAVDAAHAACGMLHRAEAASPSRSPRR